MNVARRPPPPGWETFCLEMLEAAKTPFFDMAQQIPHDYVPPHELRNDLKEIEKALSSALKALRDLEHRAGQDLQTEPYRFHVAMHLYAGRHFSPRAGSTNEEDEPFSTFPTLTIRRIRELKDAARTALDHLVPVVSGNHERRDPISARRAFLAKNFVWKHRARFDDSAPSHSEGSLEVDLFVRVLEAAGLDVDSKGNAVDAGRLIRTAKEKQDRGYGPRRARRHEPESTGAVVAVVRLPGEKTDQPKVGTKPVRKAGAKPRK